jgi:hypothetical protein
MRDRIDHGGRGEHDEKQERKASTTASASKGEKRKKESVIPANAGIQFVAARPKGCQFKGCGAPRRSVRSGFPLSRE